MKFRGFLCGSRMHARLALGATLASGALMACESAPASAAKSTTHPSRSPSNTGATTRPIDDSPLVAMVDGDAIDFAPLRVSLIELGGEQTLKDAVLDARLRTKLAREKIVVTTLAIERERTLLLEALSTDRARAIELLGAVRRRQGLGDSRFDALLRRNAGLRALVAAAVVMDEVGLASAFDVAHGPRRTARVAILPTLAAAENFSADAAAGRAFMDLAVERSLDESAARGGLLAPLSRRDPSYPESLRAAIFATSVGAISPPILDESRFYVVTVLSERPADGVTPEASRGECEHALRLSRERLLMDALARELASLEGVTIFDRAFDHAK